MINKVLLKYFNRLVLNMRRSAGSYANLILVLLLTHCISASASQIVLQDIKITARDEDTDIDIDLGLPLQYVKHFPQSFGEIIQVQLKLDAEQGREIHKEVRQGNELQAPQGREPILIYVTYEEGVPGGPYLTLRFVKPVRFRMEPQKSLSTLSITVFGEKEAAEKIPELKDQPGDTAEPPKTALAIEPPKQESDLGQLMAKARQALTFGDNEGAIRLLRKIISVSGNPHEQDARELLGLALERSGQIPRAKFEYKKYLEIYKEGAGPVRVRQRLTALENIGGIARREKLRVAKRARKVEEYKIFGRWSQDYSIRLLEQNSDDPEDDERTILGSVVTSERTSSHASLRGRYRTNDRIVQTVFIGSHNLDYRDSERTEGRISDLYLDWDEIQLGLTAVIGRQRARSSGIYDRFDGLDAAYRVVDGVTPHILAGKTVFFHDLGYDKNFKAVRTELGKRKAKLTGNAYVVSQNIEDHTDRQAVGGDFRFTMKEHSFFGGLDYDTYFSELDLLNLRWGWQFHEKSRLNLSYDFRQLIMYSNALYNLRVTEADTNTNRLLTFDEFKKIFSEERAMELAKNRTGSSTSITIGNTYQLDKNQQINVDLSYYRSAPYEAFFFTPAENDKYLEVTNSTVGLYDYTSYKATTSYNFTAQYIANDVFSPQDLHIVGLRYNKFADTFNDYVLFWNGRMAPWFTNWNPRPRLNLGYRESTGAEGVVVQANRLLFSPSLKLDRRWKKEWILETELGFDGYYYLVDHTRTTPDDQRGWFFRIGYHYTF